MITARIRRIASVRDFPWKPGLSIVTLEASGSDPEADLVSAKLDDGSSRYNPGDWTVLLPEDGILPEWLLRKMDFWDATKNKGTLAGGKGNRLKGRKFKSANPDDASEEFILESKGALYGDLRSTDDWEKDCLLATEDGEKYAQLGDDVAAMLGIAERAA